MTIAAWIAQREPAPPTALAARVQELARETPVGMELPEAMLALAAGALERLLAQGDVARDGALELLAIDALATYAFEAQGEAPDGIEARCTWAMGELSRVVERV